MKRLLLILFILGVLDYNVKAQVPMSEREALIALYNATDGENWNNNTNWNTEAPVSTWYGIHVELENGQIHVYSLGLGNNNLTGNLPPEIGDFPELRQLLLYGNNLSGELPSEIGNLENLYEIHLGMNNFTGTVPEEIGNLVNLNLVYIYDSGLTGPLPSTMQNLESLYLLDLSGPNEEAIGNFWGEFPDLTQTSLNVLRIDRNRFEFVDLAENFDFYLDNVTLFEFSPQFTMDEEEEVGVTTEGSIELTLTDVSSEGLSANEYQWFKDGVSIDGANSPTYYIDEATEDDEGVYHAEITNPDLPEIIILRLPINLNVGQLTVESPEVSKVKIYPNPVNSVLHIEAPENFSDKNVRIFDALGKKVPAPAFISGSLNLSHLESVVYFLNLSSEEFNVTKRIVKE